MEETTYSSADAGQCRACCGRVLSISGVRPRRAVGGAGRAEISKLGSPHKVRSDQAAFSERIPRGARAGARGLL